MIFFSSLVDIFFFKFRSKYYIPGKIIQTVDSKALEIFIPYFALSILLFSNHNHYTTSVRYYFFWWYWFGKTLTIVVTNCKGLFLLLFKDIKKHKEINQIFWNN